MKRSSIVVGILLLMASIAGAAEPPPLQLPGATNFDAALQARLRAAAQELEKSGRRSEHRLPDGSPRFINRLALSTSPYLQQHALNPVNWYPWGEEAFAAAQRENKPVFVSIGYATCHWCHVMERESFDDPTVAELLNRNFIAIKVDREERPDIDAVYIAAVQKMGVGGGWPLNVFLTPAREPFYGGTYFPPEELGGRPSFSKLLTTLATAWKTKQESVLQAGASFADALRSTNTAPAQPLDDTVLKRAVVHLTSLYDVVHAGFGKAPKFPQVHTVVFLLRYWQHTGIGLPRTMSLRTLDAMARGGINDLIGGGFHRYSTDAEWKVPHYEKMLYDQALNARAFLEAARGANRLDMSGTAREIFTYVLRDMASPQGAFYSAEDADSGGVEGAYYTFTRREILNALGQQDGEWIADFFGILNEEQRSSLTIPVPSEEFMKNRDMNAESFIKAMARARASLYAVRNQRPRPLRDDKILAGWNGLMIAALADGTIVTHDPKYVAAAKRAAEFVLGSMQSNGRLMHSYRGTLSNTPGFLEDYADLILGLHELYEATQETRWLGEAARLTQDMIRLFDNPQNGSLRFSAADNESLIAPAAVFDDAAMPSAHSVAAYELLRLGHLLQRAEFTKRGHAMLAENSDDVQRSPTAYTFLLQAVDFDVNPRQEIVIAGDPASADTKGLITTVQTAYLPRAVLALHAPGDTEIERLIPFISKQTMSGGKATAYVCQNYECKLPMTDSAKLKEHLDALAAPPPTPSAAPSQPAVAATPAVELPVPAPMPPHP